MKGDFILDYKQKKDSIITPEWCKTPDMGEYITNDMLEAMADNLENANSEIDGEYFIDAPFSTVLGYHETENAFVISVNKLSGIIDGDTFKISYSDINDGNKSFTFLGDGKEYGSVKKFLYQTLDLSDTSQPVSVRIVGINAPEVPHCRNSYAPAPTVFYYAKYSELLDNNNVQMYKDSSLNSKADMAERDNCQFLRFAYDIGMGNDETDSISCTGKRDHDDIVKFIKNTSDGDDIYYEVLGGPYDKKILDDEDIKLPVYFLCFSSSCNNNNPEDIAYYSQGLNAGSEINELIKKSSEILFVLDGTCFKGQKNDIPLEYQSESAKMSQDPSYAFKSFYKQLIGEKKTYKRLGYNYFGQEYN